MGAGATTLGGKCGGWLYGMHGNGVSSRMRPGTRSLNSVKKRREPVPARDAVD
ncbi:hypothetical protein PCANC_00113 [Puccinia coronata f. sp. avenae]|uniref:Uncharacterized protein n=1 Tax=Puccinia coronata f. sp. avenae TaxID=200324 RepID=A0A2N5W8V8_9BASI|nr:hypothetical protein PCANC_00113 [Puccinia coronata f. sp. avenae]